MMQCCLVVFFFFLRAWCMLVGVLACWDALFDDDLALACWNHGSARGVGAFVAV